MTVLFVHGAAMDGRMWQPHIEALDRPGRAVTLAYFGPNPDTSRPYALDTHRDDIIEAAEAIDGPVTLVAWSAGCPPALEAALSLGKKVERVILYEPGAPQFVALADMPFYGAAATADYGPIVAHVSAGQLAMANAHLLSLSASREDLARVPKEMEAIGKDNLGSMKAQFSAPPFTFNPLRYRDIAAPVTVLWGADTRNIFAMPSRGAARMFGDGHSGPVDGKRHLWPMVDPVGFANHVESML